MERQKCTASYVKLNVKLEGRSTRLLLDEVPSLFPLSPHPPYLSLHLLSPSLAVDMREAERGRDLGVFMSNVCISLCTVIPENVWCLKRLLLERTRCTKSRLFACCRAVPPHTHAVHCAEGIRLLLYCICVQASCAFDSLHSERVCVCV